MDKKDFHKKKSPLIRTSQEDSYHIPVMLKESLDTLITDPDGIYVDATMGGAGHTKEILKKLSLKGHLYSFDQDPEAKANAPQDPRFTFIASNFRYLPFWMDFYRVQKLTGVLADLGVSSHHFDTPERGFSFRFDNAPLDMRMNNQATQTASEILTTYEEEHLKKLFKEYGELTDAKKIAQRIVTIREEHPINTSTQFIELLEPFLPQQMQQRHRKLSRIFQSLRIEVNDELGALRDFLVASMDRLSIGGRIVVLTYHSLEDRLVKESFLSESKKKLSPEEEIIYGFQPGKIKILYSKGIKPSSEEMEKNSRATSAKMRVAECLDID